jgi:glycosyltransferase involved in cell wall biosynthesis
VIEGKISLILPAHNEGANIEWVVNAALVELPKHFSSFEILIVNDGSVDNTGVIADRLAAEHPEIRVVHHPKNRGYGAAITSGFEAAVGDYLFFMDSDRQFDVVDVERLVPFVEEYDVVAGYRIKRSDAFHRYLMGSTFTTVANVLFRVKMRDIDCGFRIFKTDVLKGMTIQSPGALINTEIFAKVRRQKRTVKEVGVRHFPRVEGEQSGASPRVVIRALVELLRLWWRMRSYRPSQRQVAGKQT